MGEPIEPGATLLRAPMVPASDPRYSRQHSDAEAHDRERRVQVLHGQDCEARHLRAAAHTLAHCQVRAAAVSVLATRAAAAQPARPHCVPRALLPDACAVPATSSSCGGTTSCPLRSSGSTVVAKLQKS